MMKKHVHKVLVLALAPLLMATQCDDDFDNSGFETTYLLQNDSTTDLFLLTESDTFVELASQSEIAIGSDLNQTTEPIAPSASFLFSNIKLYSMENSNFILVYEQNPLDDALWQLSEPTINRFEYTLMITDNLLD